MELFKENAQWIWNEFDHVFIEQLFQEKINIDKYLDDDNKDNVNKKQSHKKSTKEKLDKLNQEFLISQDRWDLLKSLHNLEKSDFSDDEIDEIKIRQEKREALDEEYFETGKEERERKKEEAKEKIKRCNDLYMSGVTGIDKSSEDYISEDELDDLMLEADESINYYKSKMIEEDIKFLNDKEE